MVKCDECDNIAVVTRKGQKLCASCGFDKEKISGSYKKTHRRVYNRDISTKQRAWSVSPSDRRDNVA